MILVKFIGILLAMVALAPQSFADPPPASHDHWRNTNYPSHYILYDQTSHTYVETVDCRVFWRFTVVANELNQITLYDASRGMTVRLTYDGMYLKPAGQRDFTFYQAGTFDTRTLFRHNDANGAYTGTIIKRNACAWEEYFPGNSAPAYRFVQSGIDANAVEMYDQGRNMTVRLDVGRMYLRQGNGPFNFFKNGRWH